MSSAHRHKKKFGQNFLNNPRVVEQMIQVIQPQKDQHFVEIGPGEAALTLPLLDQVGQLDLIEIDFDLHNKLRQWLGSAPHWRLHPVDALTFDYHTLVTPETHGSELRMVGNLPYNISTPLLFHLAKFHPQIIDMHFMLQKEVVERICATPGQKTFGRLSVMMQYACHTQALFEVGPDNFTPPPKVHSAIVRLAPRRTRTLEAQDFVHFSKLVKQAFSQKRKTLKNTLKPMADSAMFDALNISPQQRAEQCSVEDFIRMSNFLSQTVPD